MNPLIQERQPNKRLLIKNGYIPDPYGGAVIRLVWIPDLFQAKVFFKVWRTDESVGTDLL